MFILVFPVLSPSFNFSTEVGSFLHNFSMPHVLVVDPLLVQEKEVIVQTSGQENFKTKWQICLTSFLILNNFLFQWTHCNS